MVRLDPHPAVGDHRGLPIIVIGTPKKKRTWTAGDAVGALVRFLVLTFLVTQVGTGHL